MRDETHAAPPADGAERILVPGEREWEHCDRAMATGMPLSPDLVAALREAAGTVGLDLAAEPG